MKPPRVSLAAGIVFLIALALPFGVNALIQPGALPHKALDAAAIILGSAGIFAAMREAQRVYSANSLRYVRNYAKSHLSTIEYLSSVEKTVLAARVDRLKREGSDGPLLTGYSKYLTLAEELHAWAAIEQGQRSGERDLPSPLELDWEVPVEDPELQAVRERMVDQINSYRSKYSDWTAVKSQVERSFFEELSLVLSPFLVSVAVFIALLSKLNELN